MKGVSFFSPSPSGKVGVATWDSLCLLGQPQKSRMEVDWENGVSRGKVTEEGPWVPLENPGI